MLRARQATTRNGEDCAVVKGRGSVRRHPYVLVGASSRVRYPCSEVQSLPVESVFAHHRARALQQRRPTVRSQMALAASRCAAVALAADARTGGPRRLHRLGAPFFLRPTGYWLPSVFYGSSSSNFNGRFKLQAGLEFKPNRNKRQSGLRLPRPPGASCCQSSH